MYPDPKFTRILNSSSYSFSCHIVTHTYHQWLCLYSMACYPSAQPWLFQCCHIPPVLSRQHLPCERHVPPFPWHLGVSGIDLLWDLKKIKQINKKLYERGIRHCFGSRSAWLRIKNDILDPDPESPSRMRSWNPHIECGSGFRVANLMRILTDPDPKHCPEVLRFLPYGTGMVLSAKHERCDTILKIDNFPPVLGIRTIFFRIRILILFFRPIRTWIRLLLDLDPNPNMLDSDSDLSQN